MAVEPVGAVLHDGKAVGESFTRRDTRITDPRYTVLLIRQDQAVPVDRRVLGQVVCHVDRDIFTFLEPQNRTRRCAVVADACLGEVPGVDLHTINCEIVLASERRG